MKKVPLLFEIYIILFLLLMVPMILVTYTNSDKLLRYSENEIAKSANNNLSSVINMNEIVMNNVKTEVIKLSKHPNVNSFRFMKSYDSLKDIDNISIYSGLMNAIRETLYSDSSIQSIYFYLEDADYVLTTNYGVVKLEDLKDEDWIDLLDSSELDGNELWIPRRVPFSKNTSINNKEENSKVISFIYKLSPLVTSTKGAFVVNIYENDFNDLINSTEFDSKGNTFIIDSQGLVLSHKDKELFMTYILKEEYIKKILEQQKNKGYVISGRGNQKVLYAYSKEGKNGWIYVSGHALSVLMKQAKHTRNSGIFLMVILTSVWMMIAFFAAYRLTKPLNSLLNSMKGKEGIKFHGEKNELKMLETAFHQIAEQELILKDLVKEKEVGAKELYLIDLLRGNLNKYSEAEPNNQVVFPYNNFLVAFLTLDGLEFYKTKYSPDQIYFFYQMVLTRLESIRMEETQFLGVLYDKKTIACMINVKSYDCVLIPNQIKGEFKRVQEEMRPVIEGTFSIGIGGCHNYLYGIKDSAYEAAEALKRRMLIGKESIILWDGSMTETGRYFYPYDRETHILNCLNIGNADQICMELKAMMADIKGYPKVSYDNIIQIFNQLMGVTIKYLVENNINISDVFGYTYNVYGKMSSKETLDELEQYLVSFYTTVNEYMIEHSKGSEGRYIDKILDYIHKNYKKDIDLELMSGEIGISYSYVRKIIKEVTGKSLLDYLNGVRIDEAKRLLRETNTSIAYIAEHVGFNNVQSFNRYFKKQEGINPGEYRHLK